MKNIELGRLGEAKARAFLIQQGHEILHQNWHFRHLEVDIISQFLGKIHVTEVKTRQTAEIGEPWRAVTKAKQRQIIKVADYYLKTTETDLETQFNIVSIVHNQYKTELEYLPDAFTP